MKENEQRLYDQLFYEVFLRGQIENKYTSREKKQKKQEIDHLIDTFKFVQKLEKRDLGVLKNLLSELFLVPQNHIPKFYYDEQRKLLCYNGFDVAKWEEVKKDIASEFVSQQKKILEDRINFLFGPKTEKYSAALKFFLFKKLLVFDDRKGSSRFYPVGASSNPVFQKFHYFEQSNEDTLLLILEDLQKLIDAHKLSEDKMDTFGDDAFADLYYKNNKTLRSRESLEKDGVWKKHIQRYIDSTFYTYYTIDASGNYVVPRLTIQVNKLGTVKRISGDYGWDNAIAPHLIPIMDAKLKELGASKTYFNYLNILRRSYYLSQKEADKKEFTRADLTFIYDINEIVTNCVGLPIKEHIDLRLIREKTHLLDDLACVFDVPKSQIATTEEQLKTSPQDYTCYCGGLLCKNEKDQSMLKNIKYLYGSLSFWSQNIDLPHLEYVGGCLEIMAGSTVSLPSLKVVRRMMLPSQRELKGIETLQKVKVLNR